MKGHAGNKHPLNVLADEKAGEASQRAKQLSTDLASSLLLYRDSKNRTSMPQETSMLQRIYQE